METRPIFALLGLLAAGAIVADEAYTWTDENGVVHFSDRPQPGAKAIDLPESQARRPAPTRRSTPTNSTNEPAATDDAADEPFSYTSIDFASPAAEETLWNIEGVLNVSLNLQPALQPGHQVRVYFDGNAQIVGGTSFQLEEVWRGVHNIQAEVLDETGTLMIRSRTNRFYVQQNTVF